MISRKFIMLLYLLLSAIAVTVISWVVIDFWVVNETLTAALFGFFGYGLLGALIYLKFK
jgi:hypothetical protein